jgi:hypothetical protein
MMRSLESINLNGKIIWTISEWRHDIQHNDTKHNVCQHNDIQRNYKYNEDTQHNGRAMLCWVSFMLTVAYKPFMLSVIVLNVVMLSVVVPSVLPLTSILFYFWTQWFALNAAHQQMSEASKFGRNYIIIPLFFRRCPFRQVAEGQRERDRTRPGRLLNCAMKCKMWEGRNSLRTVIPKHLLTFGYYAYGA